jgi:hypothetical protein
MKFAAWYGIVVGVLMIVQWMITILTGGVPEFQTEPWRISFHLAAEFATAIALIASGTATLTGKPWGIPLLLAALGMVIYSEIASPGYFAQQGQWAFVVMFAVVLLGALLSLRLLYLHLRYQE